MSQLEKGLLVWCVINSIATVGLFLFNVKLTTLLGETVKAIIDNHISGGGCE